MEIRVSCKFTKVYEGTVRGKGVRLSECHTGAIEGCDTKTNDTKKINMYIHKQAQPLPY